MSSPEAPPKVNGKANGSASDYQTVRLRAFKYVSNTAVARDILLFLVAFRILNALSVSTFFQPDEYFQSLEPAWQIAFGPESGAWITWEWKHHLRSSIHPFIFAATYRAANLASSVLQLSPTLRADLLIASPKALQAVIAAVGDYYTWKLGQRVYGQGSNEAWAALFLTVCSPWQWFCLTRTLSNCFETTLTVVALYLWPWQWGQEPTKDDDVDEDGLRTGATGGASMDNVDQVARLRRCLLLAALACVLRPTNLLIWAYLGFSTLLRTPSKEKLRNGDKAGMVTWLRSLANSFLGATNSERMVLVRETALCGTLVLIISAMFDRIFYRQWTFPPMRFLYFNIAQSLAVFYGRNRWDYYLSEGLPLLLTTYIPFGILGLYRAFQVRSPDLPERSQTLSIFIRRQLGLVSLLVPFVLSFISHKEVRFIYPLLPVLHVLAAAPFTDFFLLAVSPVSPIRNETRSHLKVLALGMLVGINILIGFFATQYHQPGPLSVLAYLRHEHQQHYLTQPPATAHIARADTTMIIGFLMPCHSTPWRSHLVHPDIKGWALGCEPPVNLNSSEHEGYLDEADQFYADPERFLKTTLGRPPPHRKGVFGTKSAQHGLGMDKAQLGEEQAWDGKPGRKMWPEYLVFFEALEPSLKHIMKDSGYSECWRGWNSYFHDDWRRKGDIIVWCLHGHQRVATPALKKNPPSGLWS